ncbi:hypothetical protein PoB_007055100 [Plakobranchus ocellatus]|uniref:Uncharacterized protein n=1 Tax=Plakobranchus ocellatus TaxID=259542 RepID=A0AAV4DIR8_9GAST|nr:hypothetical protein PoB_007055100 [Plakobranchus ocellatus]
MVDLWEPQSSSKGKRRTKAESTNSSNDKPQDQGVLWNLAQINRFSMTGRPAGVILCPVASICVNAGER